MNNLIFWIIVCTWLIPMGIRMYNRSRQRRIQDDYRNFPGNQPGPYNPGQYNPGQYTPGRYDPRPYDPSRYPPSQYDQPPVVFPVEPQPVPEPQPPVATPTPQAAPPSSATPRPNSVPQQNSAPQPDSVPHGYRARKLAELDQQYSDGKIAMEEYMKLRQEIMNG